MPSHSIPLAKEQNDQISPQASQVNEQAILPHHQPPPPTYTQQSMVQLQMYEDQPPTDIQTVPRFSLVCSTNITDNKQSQQINITASDTAWQSKLHDEISNPTHTTVHNLEQSSGLTELISELDTLQYGQPGQYSPEGRNSMDVLHQIISDTLLVL